MVHLRGSASPSSLWLLGKILLLAENAQNTKNFLDLCILYVIITNSLIFKQRKMPESPFMYPVSSLDTEIIAQVKERSGYTESTDEKFLLDFGLTGIDDNAQNCSLDAVLLFSSENRAVFHPRAGIRVFVVDGTERDEEAEDSFKKTRFDAPLIDMIDQVSEHIEGVIRKSKRLFSLFFKEVPEYPTDAWREFLINGVVHRDYKITGTEIEVWLFDDRINIESPGRLINGITVETINKKRTYAHSSRNPRVADIFAACGLMSDTGSGIKKAKKAMSKSYLNPPEFEEIATGFRVIMQNSPVFDVGDPEWEKKIRGLDLNLNQKRILIVNRDSWFSNSDYQNINNVDRDTAYREIHELVQQMFVTCEGKGRGLRYKPNL